MLNNMRDSLSPALEKIGRGFAKTKLPATFWTIVGLVIALVSGIVYGFDVQSSLLLGGVLLLVSGFFDIVDGQVARITKTTTKSGAFLDSIFDKIAEVVIFIGILVGQLAEPILVILALSLSLLVSYTRSRAESLGIMLQGVGIGERAERLLVIALVGIVGSIVGVMDVMNYAMIIICIIAGITFIQRIVISAKKLD